MPLIEFDYFIENQLEFITENHGLLTRFVEREYWHRDIGASNIGKSCLREIWLNWRHCLHEKEKGWSGNLYRLFMRGHLEEHLFAKELEFEGNKVTIEQDGRQISFSDFDGHFKCNLDGIMIDTKGDLVLLEFKTTKDKNFEEVIKKGTLKKYPQYYAQVQINMYYLNKHSDEPCTKAHIYYRNKNNDETFYEEIPYVEILAQLLRDKIVSILNAKQPPERQKEFSCKWCDFHDVCFGKKVPTLNCRNCIHATPAPNGDAKWICEKHNKELSESDQRNGCMNHLLIPEIYNSEMCSYDDDSIAYRDGMINKNGIDKPNFFGKTPLT